MAAVSRLRTRGVIVTTAANEALLRLQAPPASGDSALDFASRFFAPQLGIPEDPVTGSAHCALAPFWAKRLGKTTLRAFQASARGGLLHLQLSGEGEGGRVQIGGEAVTVMEGRLRI
jgi:PhzF family phenazine biosynthesis protein